MDIKIDGNRPTIDTDATEGARRTANDKTAQTGSVERQAASRLERLEAELARAELRTLRMQLHPHFLFNTLHVISALMSRDVATARKMMRRLSELLRLTLETDSNSRGAALISVNGSRVIEIVHGHIKITVVVQVTQGNGSGIVVA